MLSYEDWLFETGRDNTEDSYYEYQGYVENMNND